MASRDWISDGIRFDVFERDGFRCVYCGRGARDGVELQLDHVIPHSRGGSDDPDNLCTACDTCNRGKTDKRLREQPVEPRISLLGMFTCQEHFLAGDPLNDSDDDAYCGRPATHVVGVPTEVLSDFYLACDRCADFWSPDYRWRLDDIGLPRVLR